MFQYKSAPSFVGSYGLSQPPYISSPNYAFEYDEKDSWVQKNRAQEKSLDYPRILQLKSYYGSSGRLGHNPWLAPWSFPDGAPCFFCRGTGNRGDIGLPQLPCRGCQSNRWLKPSASATPQCSECHGQGLWKEKFCPKCGGKGIGSFYLSYACPKLMCGVRARTNWEIELHVALEHSGKPPIPNQHVMVTQPYLLPVGQQWQTKSRNVIPPCIC